MTRPRIHLSPGETPPGAGARADAPDPVVAAPATARADARASDAPTAADARRAALTGLRDFGAFVWENRFWVLLLGVPYLAAWWLPFYWCFREDRWWARWESAIIYQPFVPIGVAALLWADRKRIADAWATTQYRFTEKRRSGTILLLLLGCLLLFGAHLVHVAAIAVVALVLIAAGVVLRQYGIAVLRAMALPMLFFLTMMPPPSSLVSKVEKFFQSGAARSVATLARGTVSGTENTPQVLIRGSQIEITPGVNGLNVALLLASLLLFIGMLRRMRGLTTLAMMTTGAFLGLLLNFVRVAAMALTAAGSPGVSEFLRTLNPVLLVVPPLLVTLWLEKRLRPAVAWAGKRFGWLERLTARTERVTENLADTAGRTVGKRLLKAGSASTTFTERLLRGAERSFRRRRRQRRGEQQRW